MAVLALMNLRSLRKLFAKSPKTHRSVLFWHWESAPSQEWIESHVNSTLATGIGGILIDAPPSSHVADYLDDAWLTSLMTATTRVGKQRGSVWIYDDLASTTSPAKQRRFGGSPDHAQQYLHCMELSLSRDTIDHLSEHPPEAVFRKSSDSGKYFLAEVDDLSVDPTETVWCMFRKRDATHLRYLHAESVGRYLDESYGPIQHRTKRFFGNTLGVILANGAQLSTGEQVLPWDDDFAEVFEQVYGYDLRPHLLDLLPGGVDTSLRRFHYWTLVADLFKEGFAYTLKSWGEEHKVPCTGFFVSTRSLSEDVLTTGPRMPLYAQQLYPTVSLAPGESSDCVAESLVRLKQVSSVVHQMGTRGAIGIFRLPVTPLSVDEWHATTLRHLAMGVTYFALDGAHDTRGLAESTLLPQMSPMESACTFIAKYFDGLARLAWMYRRGQSSCEVLFLLPTSSIQAETKISTANSTPSSKCEHLDAHLRKLSQSLSDHQIGFDFGDEELLGLHAHADHDAVVLNEQRYSVVLLPPMTAIRSSTYALLQDFAMSGGRLLVVGTVPHLLDGTPNTEFQQFFDQNATHVTDGVDLFDYNKAIDSLVQWDCRTVAATTASGEVPQGLIANRRIWEDAEILHLVHVHTERQTMEIQFTPEVTGHVEEWEYQSGSMTPICGCSTGEEFRVEGAWEPQEARTYLFLPESLEETTAVASCVEIERVVEPTWTGTRMDGNTVALRDCRFPGHAWSKLSSARTLLRERLESTPEGVIGALEWDIFVPMQELNCTRWTVTLICPEGGRVSCNGAALEVEKDPAMPHPGLETYLLPEYISQSGRIVVEGKWHSADQIEVPILAGDFSLVNGVFTDADETIPVGLWSEIGLESYGGRVTYQARVEGDARSDDAPIILELDGLRSPAEVRVNGQVVDHVLWKPYRCDIRPFWDAERLNIEVEVAGSWYNALHPAESPIEQGLELEPLIRVYARKQGNAVDRRDILEDSE